MTLSAEDIESVLPDPPAGLDVSALDPSSIPEHIALIMDGNGRWATARGLSRSEGHKAGIEGVREAITACSDLGVRYLTIYAFSTENWKRPVLEVSGLMNLFAETLMKELKGLEDHHIRVIALGRLEELPKKTREVFLEGMEDTKNNTGMTLSFATNYGSRFEIEDAVRSIAAQVRDGSVDPDDIDETLISKNLYTGRYDIPDPDLLIRTSGEMRLSNFLLWQLAYTEIYVTDCLFPDFDRYELARAILDYRGRNRRFGGV